MCKRDYICNPNTCSCENGKYLATIIDGSVIMCDEITETRTVPTNFNEKKITCHLHLFINYHGIIDSC